MSKITDGGKRAFEDKKRQDGAVPRALQRSAEALLADRSRRDHVNRKLEPSVAQGRLDSYWHSFHLPLARLLRANDF